MVEDAAIKEKNPNAWALTSGGSVYISDSVPEELAGVVGYHEGSPCCQTARTGAVP